MQPVNPPPRPDPRIVPQTIVGNYPARDYEVPAQHIIVQDAPIEPRARALAMTVRQALLMVVDAIEVYIGTEVRTSELRKAKR